MSRLGLTLAVALSLALGTGGCATTAPPPEPVVDALLESGRFTASFESLTKRAPLAADSDFRSTPIGRDEHHSHHLVAIRYAEEPHRHDKHDLLVVMLQGHGKMLIGKQSRTVGPGSVIYIPRHTRHAFSNESGEPATAYAIFTPPSDGADRVADE